MCHNQYCRFILVIVLMLNDVYSWNYYRNYRQIDRPKVCTFIKCKADERCVNRKFLCKYPPCPNMIYCAKTEKESLRGPSTCDTVQCSKGHICVVKVRHCKWNEPCGDQLARCITESEYHNGPASCAGYKCPAGHACILRESFCIRPPCKLLRSCATKRDYHIWLEKCKSLGCLSSHECFLRRPGNVCELPTCKHTPDCIAETAAKLLAIPENCRGWICPRDEVCEAEIHEPCENFDCKIFRNCHAQLNSDEDENDEEVKKIKYQNSTGQLIHLRAELPQINSNSRGKVKSIGAPSTDKSSLFSKVNPTLSSLSSWVDFLKNETGIEAVKYWIQKAEETDDYAGFRQWLESVKELLGVKAYDDWLNEIREITADSKAFQQWLHSSTILKSSNANQSSATQLNNNVSQNNSQWILLDNESRKGIYDTQNLMNPWYQRQNVAFPPSNVPQVIPHLFIPGNRQDANSGRNYGYYILPPFHYPTGNHENLPPSTVEPNQQDMFRQFTDNSNNINAEYRASLVNLLQKLKEERLLYQDVINKTQELVARAKPLLPPSQLDELVEILQGNKSQTNDLHWNSFVTQRILPEVPKKNANQHNSSGVVTIQKTADGDSDYSTNDETEFFLVDYNDPSSLEINQTLPRILIKVENDSDSSMRIGEMGVKYDDHNCVTNYTNHQSPTNNNHDNNNNNNNNNYDDDDDCNMDSRFNLKVSVNNTGVVATTFESSKHISETA